MKTMTRTLSTRLRGSVRGPFFERQEKAGRFLWPGDVEVASQEDLFCVAGCTEIAGDLVVRGPKVTGLRELSGLVKIHGDLVIEKTSLKALDDLCGLRSVGGDLSVGDNPGLRSMRGPQELEHVGRSVFIWANERLEDVDGLCKLRSVREHLEIWGNRRLASLSGLAALESIGRDLSFGRQGFGNDRLRHFDDLGALRAVGGDLAICCNQALERVDGLAGLWVGGKVVVEHNGRLVGRNRPRIGLLQREPGVRVGALAPWRWDVSTSPKSTLGLEPPAEFEGDNRPPTR